MSLYSQYMEELGVRKIIETEFGFATYTITGNECYIPDIYIVPDKRKSQEASKLADLITEEAKKQGCKYLFGTVHTSIKDPTRSIKVLLGYGFNFLRVDKNSLIFMKEIHNG